MFKYIVLSSANYDVLWVSSIDILLLFKFYYKCFIRLNATCPSSYRLIFSLEPKPCKYGLQSGAGLII